MKTTINFYDMTTLIYLVIKEKFEKMWVVGPYFVWWRIVTYYFELVWVIVGGWGIILGGWRWVGHYLGGLG